MPLTIKYIARKNESQKNKIVLAPENENNFVHNGIYFWTAEIMTHQDVNRNNIQTVIYRFNVTNVSYKLYKLMQKYPSVNGKWANIAINDNAKRILENNFKNLNVNCNTEQFDEVNCHIGVRTESPFSLGVDIKKDSNEKFDVPKYSNGIFQKTQQYSKERFGIDIHIHNISDNDLSPGKVHNLDMTMNDKESLKPELTTDPQLVGNDELNISRAILLYSELMLDYKSQLNDLMVQVNSYVNPSEKFAVSLPSFINN